MRPRQCIAARSLLGWKQVDLAERSGVSVSAVRNFERGASSPIRGNLAALRKAFEGAGIELADDGTQGIRLRKGESMRKVILDLGGTEELTWIERRAMELCRHSFSRLMIRVEGDKLEICASFGEESSQHVVLRLAVMDVLLTAAPELGFGKDEDAAAIKAAYRASAIYRKAAAEVDGQTAAAEAEHSKVWSEQCP